MKNHRKKIKKVKESPADRVREAFMGSSAAAVTSRSEGMENIVGQPVYTPNPYTFNPYYPNQASDKWKCDSCGHEEDMRTRATIRFSTPTNDTGDMCPNCLINYLKEHIPQLRKVNDND